jgi:hypothetical protein
VGTADKSFGPSAITHFGAPQVTHRIPATCAPDENNALTSGIQGEGSRSAQPKSSGSSFLPRESFTKIGRVAHGVILPEVRSGRDQ